MSRWVLGRRGLTRRRATAAPDRGAGAPEPAAAPGADGGQETFAVEEFGGLVLLRLPTDDTLGPADIEDLTRSVTAADDDHTVTVVAGADATTAPALWPRLATLLDALREEGTTTVRLVMSGVGADHPDRPAIARRVADSWDMEVIAPDGLVVVVPGGGLFVPAGEDTPHAARGWWRFRPGADPLPLGPRQPAPDWQRSLTDVPARTRGGYRVEQIPAGLLIRPTSAPAPRPGDLCYAVPVASRAPLVLVGVPGGEDVPPREVAEAVAAIAPSGRAGVGIAPGGRGDALAAGQAVADELGAETVVHSGPPLLAGGTVRATFTDAAGVPRWQPYVDAVACRPRHTPDAAPPESRPLTWNLPVSGPAGAAEATVLLAAPWQVTATRAGLWVGEADGEHPAATVRPVSPDGPLIEVGRPGETLADTLWPELDRLLGALGTEVRTRARVRVHGVCADGGQELRRLAGRHALRGVRLTPGPATRAATQARKDAPASGGAVRPERVSEVGSGPGPDAATESDALAAGAGPASAPRAASEAAPVPAARAVSGHGPVAPGPGEGGSEAGSDPVADRGSVSGARSGAVPGGGLAPGPTPGPAADLGSVSGGTLAPVPERGPVSGATFGALPEPGAVSDRVLAPGPPVAVPDVAAASGPVSESGRVSVPAPVPVAGSGPEVVPEAGRSTRRPDPVPALASLPELASTPTASATSEALAATDSATGAEPAEPAGVKAPLAVSPTPRGGSMETPTSATSNASEAPASSDVSEAPAAASTQVPAAAPRAAADAGAVAPPPHSAPEPHPTTAADSAPTAQGARTASVPPPGRDDPAPTTARGAPRDPSGEDGPPVPGPPVRPSLVGGVPLASGVDPLAFAPLAPAPAPLPANAEPPEPPLPARPAGVGHTPAPVGPPGPVRTTVTPSDPGAAPAPRIAPEGPDGCGGAGPSEAAPHSQPAHDAGPAAHGVSGAGPSPDTSGPEGVSVPTAPTYVLPSVPFPPGHVSTETERAAFRALAEPVWERLGSAVARTLMRMPALRGHEQVAARADLIALRLYLHTESAELNHAALRHGLRAGDARLLPYAACVASGLRRLPSFRGVVVRGAPSPAEGGHPPVPGAVLRDPAPVSGLAAEGGGGGADGPRYAIWSVTGRRVRQLADTPGARVSGAREEIVFSPGTAFRVLEVRPGAPGQGAPLVLLRELPLPATATTVAGGPLDDHDRAALGRLDEMLRRSPAAGPAWPDRCTGPIGRTSD
ncbi:hypothetical protein [Streptomyces sp. NPDC057702]|uniref:hypothetical protein n=1 Tax=unclassified Streptomyces TaxID=2593676 RepID=UPI003693713A